MKKEADFSNRDRFINLGLVISLMRKKQGLSQKELAEKANISRSTLSAIEAANLVRPMQVDTLFRIADALDVKAGDLLNFELPD